VHHAPFTTVTRVRAAAALACAAVLALSTAACGSSSSGGSAAGSGSGSAISSQRCAENKSAGTISYLSGYQFQSSASILEYVAASRLGYFSDLCLNVKLVPGSGDTAQDTKLLAGGKAQIAAVAEQDLIQARANGIDIEGVSSYSNAGLDILMTGTEITSLTQLDGKVVGDKGYVPASVRAMLVKAGVDWNSLKIVKEGYDPTVLPRHQGGLQALTGFVSNEPNQLKAAGDNVTVWQPVKYGIPGSLGAMAVNPAFAAAHPTAVQDLLRAALHAYSYCSASQAHVAQCVGYAAALSGPTYDTKLNEQIWTTETQVVKDNPTPGRPLGGIDPANVVALVDMLHQFSIIPASVTSAQAATWFDGSYVKAVYQGDALIWPAP
jgi:putative hydroxymethylpyrimidine transport system substrate-binding protein